jgi:hypothetical protein
MVAAPMVAAASDSNRGKSGESLGFQPAIAIFTIASHNERRGFGRSTS